MFITADNAQLFTISLGQGQRSLLALGGWAGSWEVWADTLAVLSRTWRAVGYDHRGTGATVAPLESITIEANANDEGHLYGSVGAVEIVAALKASDIVITDDQVRLQGPLKELGLYTVKVHLHQEIECDLKVWVVPTAS